MTMHSGQATGQSQSKMLFIPEIKSRHLQNIYGKWYAIGPKSTHFTTIIVKNTISDKLFSMVNILNI